MKISPRWNGAALWRLFSRQLVLGLLMLPIALLVILLLGVLACVVGLVAAAPVCVCITGAAYRQLFGQEDPAGLLRDQ